MLTPFATVARWASETISLGGGNEFVPTVVGPAGIPVVRDVAAARRRPHLAIFSALAHGNEPGGLVTVLAALAGADTLDVDTQRQYDCAIQDALDEGARRALEEIIMQGISVDDLPLPGYVQRLLAREAERASARGEAVGEARGEARAVLRVLEARGIAVSEEQRAKVLACTDIAMLERWLVRAVNGATSEGVFGE